MQGGQDLEALLPVLLVSKMNHFTRKENLLGLSVNKYLNQFILQI